MLRIADLHATVAGRTILNGLDLDIPTGEVHAIMGPNGSGKTTLSNVLAGRDGYDVSGTVTDSWNVERSADTGDITWTGVEWNRRLTPGAEASFGYCLER